VANRDAVKPHRGGKHKRHLREAGAREFFAGPPACVVTRSKFQITNDQAVADAACNGGAATAVQVLGGRSSERDATLPHAREGVDEEQEGY
jgi:hypothetical protein